MSHKLPADADADADASDPQTSLLASRLCCGLKRNHSMTEGCDWRKPWSYPDKSPQRGRTLMES